jgi:hypothetical protein
MRMIPFSHDKNNRAEENKHLLWNQFLKQVFISSNNRVRL